MKTKHLIIPDYVYVHGDTSTTMAASIAAFYSGAQVCHVEAGLRTHNKRSPFPEEINRQVTGRISDYHFAPTEASKSNLLRENISEDSILVTGNTVIDALFDSSERVKDLDNAEINQLKEVIDTSKKLVLVTGHRRENHGKGFIDICEALKELALAEAQSLLTDIGRYQQMSALHNPYGDGKACERIVEFIKRLR